MVIKYSKKVNNRDKVREKKQRRDKRDARRDVIIWLLGGQCVKCAATKNLWFTYSGKNRQPQMNKVLDYQWHKVIPILKDFYLLCETHWWKLYLKKRGQRQHGTVSMYASGLCRCKPCSDVWRVYQKEWRNKRSANKKAALLLLEQGKFKVLR